jgi:hypothetical protein
MQLGDGVNYLELMKIEDTFMIKSMGLVLVPSFELPLNGKWKNITEQVIIETPGGKTLNVEAFFSVAHLNIKDPTVSASKRWPILVTLRGVEKESVPVGSKIFVSPDTKKSITG